MLYQFDPYPDELLYSVLARYHITSRNSTIGRRETVVDAFSSGTASAVVDLPTRLSMLHLNLSQGTKYTPERIIQELTLFPLYAPFLPKDRAREVINRMKGEGDVHTTIGVMASAIPVPRFMRYCPICLAKDEEHNGQAYWHRNHQVPGVSVCHKHNTRLLNSKLQISGKINKHEFLDIANMVCQEAEVDCNISEHEVFISESVDWLFHNLVPNHGLENIRNNYLICLKKKGYANFKGRVNVDKFLRDFVGFYGRNYLQMLNCSIDIVGKASWLLKLVRKPRFAMHPIQHLLLMRFLGLTPEIFFAEKKEFKPFGTDPWPCLNPAADHFRQNLISRVDVSRDYKTGFPVGTFTCICGFSYARRGPDRSSQDRYRVGKVKQYGHIWEGKLKELANQDGVTIKQMASILGCHITTFMKYKKILKEGLIVIAKNDPKNDKIEQKTDRRERWLEIQSRFPQANRTELRQIAPADFAWLYNYDSTWLYQNMPAKTPNQKYSDTRVNWLERDKEILVKVKLVVEQELSSIKKPERLCVSMIGKRIGYLGVLQKAPDKIPKSMAYIDTISESLDDFQFRRVKYAAQELRNESQPLMIWKIVLKAGISRGYSIKVYEQILRECANQ